MYPIKIAPLSQGQAEHFTKSFADKNGQLFFEGMWFRNQRKENKAQSNWQDESTVRRRYLHFYDKYVLTLENGNHFLTLKDTYLYVSNTLPKEENLEYLNRIQQSLKQNGFDKKNKKFVKKDLEVTIHQYDIHPKNAMRNEVFPANYTSVDIIVKTKNYKTQAYYNRMWKHSMKIFRVPGVRDNPTYIQTAKEILPYLPAQIEMGCGPSIEANIPPLYDMHETYFVQNHISKQFYFGAQDKLIEQLVSNPIETAIKHAKVPYQCITAEPTQAYQTFAKLYSQGCFVGKVYNNNFDRIVKRFGIEEQMLRVFEIKTYLPKIKFDPRAKSLIVFGSHADRREVQKQAREQGLKIIHIDPEGFYENEKFIPYPVEAPQKEDLVWKVTFQEAMQKLGDLLN